MRTLDKILELAQRFPRSTEVEKSGASRDQKVSLSHRSELASCDRISGRAWAGSRPS